MSGAKQASFKTFNHNLLQIGRKSSEISFMFYAENSDEEKLRALFENEKFIVSRTENDELMQDTIFISNLINLD